MFRSYQMHVIVSQENFKYFIALVLVIDDKFRQTLSSAVSFYFDAVFSLPQLYPFSEPEPTHF